MFNKMKKEGLGNCRLVTLSSVAGNVLKEILLESIDKPMNGKKEMGNSQHRSTKSRSYLSLLSVFYVEVTCWVDKGRAGVVAYLAFSKGFDDCSNDMAIQKLRKYGSL